MGALKNILEPGGQLHPCKNMVLLNILNYFTAIVAIFTVGAWVNRKKKPLGGYDETRPLLREDNPAERETSCHVEARYARNKQYIHSRVLERFPFLLEIWYWLLIYWVCGNSSRELPP
jgi:hypothetical protein